MTLPPVAVPLVLRGSLTTARCEQTHRAVIEALAAANGIAIDCSEATEVDLSFLQILFAAQGAADRAAGQSGEEVLDKSAKC